MAAESFAYPLAEEENPCLMLPGPGFSYAPAVEGADAGVCYVVLNGKAVGKIPVVYGQTIEQEVVQEQTMLDRILEIVRK